MSKNESVNTITRDLTVFPKERILRATLQAATESGCPVAFWRLPKTAELNVMVSFKEARQMNKVDLEELGTGFVVSPFNNTEKPLHFISGDLLLSFDFNELSTSFDFQATPSEKSEHDFVNKLFDLLEEEVPEPEFHTKSAPALEQQADYKAYVSACVNSIESNKVQKVVPARFKEIEIPNHFDIIEQWLALGKAYENAFVSLVSIPKVGTWLGATPEILIQQQGDVFRTVALAATQKRDPEKAVSDTAWTQKEIEELAMVSRYIINCFKKIRLREFEEKGPKTTVAGNLLHLKTEYAVNLRETNFAELPTVMLELLHPTSAVAGMPKQAAIDIIKKWEGFDREFYSGFLGPVHVEGNTHVFVNLRCMQLFKDRARLYAGAGVTEDSDPQKEYQETEIKFNTLLNIIAPGS